MRLWKLLWLLWLGGVLALLECVARVLPLLLIAGAGAGVAWWIGGPPSALLFALVFLVGGLRR